MIKGVWLLLLLTSSSVYAAPTIFGMTLGEMSEKELKAKYNVNLTGKNKYSEGNMYSVPVSSINFEGLQEVTAIFSSDGKLLAVLTSFPKDKFDYLKNTLGGKYKLVSKQIPFVGNKKATFRDGVTEISLNAPHLSFTMSMNYINDDLMKAFNSKSQSEAKEKQQNEASQL
ncbi:hypothetical protein [Photobacterium angustum]|uniref:Uncharacterized protein n=1 Tax=Photobacterium angustum TaxID=661 RepID=A0ABX5H3Z2_PHOAN|nr:hypothetical protein [Photobacterium angustum]PSX10483.1 hypothetical protein C0W27_10655 [Photobacterium angustum]